MATRPYMFLIESMIRGYHEYGITLLLVRSLPVNVGWGIAMIPMLEVPLSVAISEFFKIMCYLFYTTFSEVQNLEGKTLANLSVIHQIRQSFSPPMFPTLRYLYL